MPKKEAKLSRYVALLRGINVGGKHKVAMKDLVYSIGILCLKLRLKYSCCNEKVAALYGVF